MIGDYFTYAVRNITHKGIRSWLTMIGIFIGIATIVSLISLGQGMQDAINTQFEQMGSNIIMLMPGQNMGAPSGASKLTDHDIQVIEGVRGVNLVGGMIAKFGLVEFGGERKYTFIAGIPTDKSQKIIEDMQSVRIHEGRKFYPTDGYRTIVAWLIQKGDFFENPVKVNDRILIEGKEFRVIGSIESVGNHQDDTNIYIPLDTAKELFDTEDYYTILVQLKEGYKPADVAEAIKERMRKDRNQKKGEEDFSAYTQEQLKETVGAVLDVVQAVLIGIASISLLVGGVGIMNTMYTSVLERTQEIGIMKAVGARNGDVLAIFLIEAGIFGLLGGLVGIGIGLGFSKAVEYFAAGALGANMLKAHISYAFVGSVLLFSFIIGCASGVFPARQAAGMNPVEALRYE
jgi:putative ABC transport system permease protein